MIEGEIYMYSNKKKRDEFLREIRLPLNSVDDSQKCEGLSHGDEELEFDQDIMDALTKKFDELFGPITDD